MTYILQLYLFHYFLKMHFYLPPKPPFNILVYCISLLLLLFYLLQMHPCAAQGSSFPRVEWFSQQHMQRLISWTILTSFSFLSYSNEIFSQDFGPVVGKLLIVVVCYKVHLNGHSRWQDPVESAHPLLANQPSDPLCSLYHSSSDFRP